MKHLNNSKVKFRLSLAGKRKVGTGGNKPFWRKLKPKLPNGATGVWVALLL